MAWLCVRQIGGQTGDVLGALEQVGEILIVVARRRPPRLWNCLTPNYDRLWRTRVTRKDRCTFAKG